MQQYRPFGLLDAGYEDTDPRRALTLAGGGAYGPTPNADAIGQFAYGLTNLGGVQDAAGLLGGPSLKENVAAGNKWDAAGQLAGLLPVAGGALKGALGGIHAMAMIPKSAKAAAKMAKSAETVSEAAPESILAFHSSPHDFDSFDLSKIGTGEGNQVYGHGLYFAENPAVSDQGGDYWRQFFNKMKSGPEKTAAGSMLANKFDRDAAAQTVEKTLAYHSDQAKPGRYGNGPDVEEGHRLLAEEAQQAQDMLRNGQLVGPRTYQVRINADPEHFLDYEKPLSEQSPAVQQIIGNIPAAPDRASWPHVTGNDLHEQLRVDAMGDDAFMGSSGYRMQRRNEAAVDVAKTLRDAGIPGIKYLDAGSRGSGDGSRNYVVFDDKLIDILKKYGLVGLLGGAAINAQSPNAQQSAPGL